MKTLEDQLATMRRLHDPSYHVEKDERLGRPNVLRATPGCLSGCQRCHVGCAVAAGYVERLEREIAERDALSGTVLMHAGILYPTEVGNA